MFLKAATPTIRDTVKVLDATGVEITRFVAVWKRPDSKTRKDLLKERLNSLSHIRVAQTGLASDTPDIAGFEITLSNIEAESKTRIREHLHSVDGLLDANDKLVEWSPAALDALLQWVEYANPLAESLARLAEGKVVEEAQAKNAEAPVLSGQAPEPVAA
ncbi:hypothetical protein [Thiothrix lacustris]|uniref:hypothetical protein n=1 Tax=Thiothrix lacustris TaxID=525917 RepID=UPI00048DD2E9|nr:hypothetical protein [Thiothrix lacustris]